MTKEGMKHGVLQNVTVGGGVFDSSVEIVTCMQDLSYDLIDDEWWIELSVIMC